MEIHGCFRARLILCGQRYFMALLQLETNKQKRRDNRNDPDKFGNSFPIRKLHSWQLLCFIFFSMGEWNERPLRVTSGPFRQYYLNGRFRG